MAEFAGLRVLVVEDEGIVALMIEDMLHDLGCKIAASVARLADAEPVAASAELDFALLDVNVADEPVFPIAAILRERGIPFIFSTGYGATGLPPEFADYLVLGKPFSEADLEKTIALALAADTVGGA